MALLIDFGDRSGLGREEFDELRGADTKPGRSGRGLVAARLNNVHRFREQRGIVVMINIHFDDAGRVARGERARCE